jgi:hypothetical protein
MRATVLEEEEQPPMLRALSAAGLTGCLEQLRESRPQAMPARVRTIPLVLLLLLLLFVVHGSLILL